MNKLEYKFIRIATLSVAAVMLILTLILNVANFCTTDANLKATLDMISENEGNIPESMFSDNEKSLDLKESSENQDNIGKNPPPRNGYFNEETPFSTRYFLIRYDNSGNVLSANLDKIAAVNNENISEFVNIAQGKSDGYFTYGDYKALTKTTDTDKHMAIFLDAHQEFKNLKTVLFWSLLADVVCITLVLVLVTFFSRRAIDPIVKANNKQKQFITDASHELKTPITVISTNMSLLEMELGKNMWIEKTKNQLKRLTSLVNSLVFLSKYDEEDLHLTKAEFNISEVLQEVMESFESARNMKEITFNVKNGVNITYYGNVAAIRQLMSIIIDNAIKYAES